MALSLVLGRKTTKVLTVVQFDFLNSSTEIVAGFTSNLLSAL